MRAGATQQTGSSPTPSTLSVCTHRGLVFIPLGSRAPLLVSCRPVQKLQVLPWIRGGVGQVSLGAHAPMLWGDNQKQGGLAALDPRGGRGRRGRQPRAFILTLWTGKLSHSWALNLDEGRMAGPRSASLLQVSGPGLRGGCG